MSIPAPHFLLYAEVPQALAHAGMSPTGCWHRCVRWRICGSVAICPAATRRSIVARSSRRRDRRQPPAAGAAGGRSRLGSARTAVAGDANDRRQSAFARGLQFGLREWRENDWQWERYGRMAPVKDRDLWRRLDRLVEIHSVACGPGTLEKASDLAAPPNAPQSAKVQRQRRSRRGSELVPGPRGEAPSTKSQTPNKSRIQMQECSKPWSFQSLEFSEFRIGFDAWNLVLGILKGGGRFEKSEAGDSSSNKVRLAGTSIAIHH